MTKFKVSVVLFNTDKFRDDYSQYITSETEDYVNVVFTLNAPQNIYDEIAGLKEECIEIIEEEETFTISLTERQIHALIRAANLRLDSIKGYKLKEEDDLRNIIEILSKSI
jgi:hypothetical protein